MNELISHLTETVIKKLLRIIQSYYIYNVSHRNWVFIHSVKKSWVF